MKALKLNCDWAGRPAELTIYPTITANLLQNLRDVLWTIVQGICGLHFGSENLEAEKYIIHWKFEGRRTHQAVHICSDII